MLDIIGIVERVTYYNQENGYSVLRLKPENQKNGLPGLDLEGLLTVVGNLPMLSPGEKITISGDYSTHPKHGLQFRASSCKKLLPVTITGIERYLGSGLIKGIGPQLSKRIVKHFKGKTLEIIENDPQQLASVPGIGPDRTEKIIKAWEEQQQVKEIMLFFHGHEISSTLAVKIYKQYGDKAIEVVKENPYQLEQDIFGIGFKTADRIAQDLGLAHDHPSRIEAGIVYTLNSMINNGHVFAPYRDLIKKAAELLEVDTTATSNGINRLLNVRRVKRESIVPNKNEANIKDKCLKISENKPEFGEDMIYLTPFYHSERGVTQQLFDLASTTYTIHQKELQFNQQDLSQEQQQAIRMAVSNPISVITGGPGTGKTTCLKALILNLELHHFRYALTSPTGRAAKRLSEATSRPAQTIHRLLGYSPDKGFQYNEKFPFKIDYLVVDEASMLDLLLAYHLLKALKPGTQVLFVGDADQLPSVGAGDVLRDIISSQQVPVTRLTTIFRQEEDSLIIQNAHRINHGEMPFFSKSTQGDFFLFPAEDAETARDWITELVSERIPQKFGFDSLNDIQIISPIYRGEAGVDALNRVLQEKLNPPNKKKAEIKLFGRIYRVGDKIMQMRNNYDKDVFNGDIGHIRKIDPINQIIEVLFDQSQRVFYDFSEADEMALAYAVSVHKSQGSEFPVIVMPVLTQHYIMLQRNLLYTGVTRAQKMCVLIGNNKAIRIAINNNKVSLRHSYLANRIKNQFEGSKTSKEIYY